MNPRLFEGPEENDFPRGSGGEHRGQRSRLCREPQEGFSTAIFAPVLTAIVSPGPEERIHGSQEPEGDPDAPGFLSR